MKEIQVKQITDNEIMILDNEITEDFYIVVDKKPYEFKKEDVQSFPRLLFRGKEIYRKIPKIELKGGK